MICACGQCDACLSYVLDFLDQEAGDTDLLMSPEGDA